jgi:hypothetical protein
VRSSSDQDARGKAIARGIIIAHRTSSISCAIALASAASQFAFAGQPGFTDVTAASGMVVVPSSFDALVLADYPYWTLTMKGGGAIGDFNNDGWQDIFVVPGINDWDAPSQLYVNNKDGTFTDRAADWHVADCHYGGGAAAGDFNGDGWLDIFVLSWGPNTGLPLAGQHKLYRNNGNGTFTDVAVAAGVNSTGPNPDGFGAAFGDYDLDGDLDLAVAAWYPNSGGNRLFRNNGDGTFTDVTAAALQTDMTAVQGFSPRFVDMDGDGYPELLFVADFETTRYFVNNRDGTFSNQTAASGVGLESNGMGSAVGDFNNDGLLDWYVTSIQYSTYWHTATGNMLYINQGGHHYVEQSVPAGVKDGGWGWGTVAIDIDHDGLLDLVETNGWIAYPPYLTDPTRAFRNKGDGTFSDIAPGVGLVHTGNGRGLVHLDYDNDGDQDIVIFGQDKSIILFRNDLTGPGSNWLRIFFDTKLNKKLAPNGFGTRVTAALGASTLLRYMDGGCSYHATSELSAHFGLGAVSEIPELKVTWANGKTTTIKNLAANKTITVRAIPADLDGDCVVGQADLGLLLSNYGCTAGAGACSADLDGDGKTGQADLGILLSAYGTSCLGS